MNFFFLLPWESSVFCHFYYSASWCRSIWIYFIWALLCFLYMNICFFRFGKFSAIISSNTVSISFSLSSPSGAVLCVNWHNLLLSHQFSSVAQSCPTLFDPMNCCTPGLPVHHQLPEFTQTHMHRVSDAIQPSHSLSSPSSPALNPSQHQSLFQWVSSSHEVAKVLEFQL